MTQTILPWNGRCTICGELRDKTEFPTKKRQCFDCKRKKAREAYHENIETSRLQGRMSNEKHKVRNALKRYGYEKGHEIACPNCKIIIKV